MTEILYLCMAQTLFHRTSFHLCSRIMITLRAGTYLSPSLPVEYFEMLLAYVEQKLGIHSTLLYESRWEGPRGNREDPFKSGYLDLGNNCLFSYPHRSCSFLTMLYVRIFLNLSYSFKSNLEVLI